MLKSRLIQVLRTFSKKEFRELHKWVNSPAHNQREDVSALYQYLVTSNHLFEDSLLNKEYVFPKIYKGESFDDSKMRQVMHFLFKVVEEFLFFQKESEYEINKKLSLLQVYRERNLGKSFLKTQKDIDAYFAKAINPNEKDFINNYYFQLEIVEFKSKIKQSQELNLQELTDSYDLAFIVEKLKHACLILSHQRVYNTNYQINLLPTILEYISSNNLIENRRIGINYYLYKVLSENQVDDFFALKKYLQEIKSIPKAELKNAYIYSINFCISQMNTGNEPFIEEAYELYKSGIESKILIDNNILSRWTFNNTVSIALRLKKFDWVSEFIENYHHYLEVKYRDNFLYFNYAKLYYAQKEYEKVRDVLQKYEFNDVLINLDAKTMLLKIYYELDEFKVLESLLESMRAFIQRKKILGYHKALYKNMVKYTKKLLKVNPYSKAQKEKLKAEIETAKPLTEKAWLLKQLGDL